MSITIGDAVLYIRASTEKLKSDLEKGVKAAEPMIQKTGGLNAKFKELTGVSISSAAAIALVTSTVKKSIDAAMEAEKVQAQTNAIIKATGGAAGMTADEISRLAGEESRLTGIDDEVIQSGANMLLTFKNIGEETFPTATRAIEDMAVAMNNGSVEGIDLAGTAIMVGKALNDPIAGMSALQRVGVTFNETQKQQIKDFMAQNDLASAQAIILKELQSEFGGAAEAAGNTTAGQFAKFQNAAENLYEALGTKLLPTLTKVAEELTWQMTSTDRITTGIEELTAQYNRGELTLAEYKAQVKALADTEGLLIDKQGNLRESLFGTGIMADNYGKVLPGIAEESANLAEQTILLNGTYEDYKTKLTEAAAAQGYWIDQTGTLRQGLTQVIQSNYLLSETTFAQMEAQQMLNTEVDLARRYFQGMNSELQTTTDSAVSAATQINGVRDSLNALDGQVANSYVNVFVTTYTSGHGPVETYGQEQADYNAAQQAALNQYVGRRGGRQNPAGTGGAQPGGANAGTYPGDFEGPPGFAEGGSFIVPPGYQNDTYPLGPFARASSGEEVIVRKPGESGGAQVVMYVENLYASNQQDIDTLLDRIADGLNWRQRR